MLHDLLSEVRCNGVTKLINRYYILINLECQVHTAETDIGEGGVGGRRKKREGEGGVGGRRKKREGEGGVGGRRKKREGEGGVGGGGRRERVKGEWGEEEEERG